MKFEYPKAFSRNIGWVTEEEQNILRRKRVAIAGMGGVGGSHLLTLTRLGISGFNISDLDRFELANFNRQAGANVNTLGLPKVEVLAERAREINPDISIKIFPNGVDSDNLSEFFTHIDCYVDGLDFFALDIRSKVFAYCSEHQIPAVTVAPLGMGAALLNFLPGKMTFEEYFRLDGKSPEKRQLRFLLGLSPAMLQLPYLVDATAVNLPEQRGPSTPMACELCAGLAASQVLKILLKRGKVLAVPWGLHFDAYRNKAVKTWRPWGNENPIQKLALKIAERRLLRTKPG